MACNDECILVTANVKHFYPILTEYGARGIDHHGAILVPYTVQTHDFGVILRGIRRLVAAYSQQEWFNRVEWLWRGD